MPDHFFPDVAFAWTVVLVLVGITAISAYFDLRWLIIPNRVTVPALVLGFACNSIRGAWLGANGQPVWILGQHGAAVGALDGFLWAFAGFALGFTLFFIMWVLQTCKGGDLKLFAALGAWVGWKLAILLLAATIFFVIAISVLRLCWTLLRGGKRQAAGLYSMAATARKREGKKPRRLTGYALPVALSTTLVLLWVFRGELHLVRSGAASVPASEQASARG